MNIDKSKLKSGANLLTQALFLETNGWNIEKAVYTLGEEDLVRGDKVIYSIRRLYVEMEDVHEYNFATKYFYSWSHWERLLRSPIVRPHIDDWRKELEAKLMSRNLKRMEELAAEGDKVAVKYMADRGWSASKPTAKRGRPSKEEKAGHLKQEAALEARVDLDYERIKGLQ